MPDLVLHLRKGGDELRRHGGGSKCPTKSEQQRSDAQAATTDGIAPGGHGKPAAARSARARAAVARAEATLHVTWRAGSVPPKPGYGNDCQ